MAEGEGPKVETTDEIRVDIIKTLLDVERTRPDLQRSLDPLLFKYRGVLAWVAQTAILARRTINSGILTQEQRQSIIEQTFDKKIKPALKRRERQDIQGVKLTSAEQLAVLRMVFEHEVTNQPIEKSAINRLPAAPPRPPRQLPNRIIRGKRVTRIDPGTISSL